MRKTHLLPLLMVLWAGAASGQTFNDVPSGHWAYNYIESLSANGITAGCGNDNYCPKETVTRAQMAVFIERGMRGGDYRPPAAKGNVFLDVAADDFAAGFIEQLYLDGITSGCGGNNYCPGDPVTRAQMAVFLLRAKYGSWYLPPAPSGVFTDVPIGSFADAWIEQLAAEGITSGCGNGNYCPNHPVTRAQMAVFLVRTFITTEAASLVLRASRFIVAPGEQSTIRATVRDASGNLVEDELVKFVLDDLTGGSLSSDSDITNSNGQAETTYTAGSTVGASGAVTITANIVNNPAVTDAVELTVAGQQVFISLGTGNALFEPDPATYEQPWTVLVTHVEGVGVAGAWVDVSVLSLEYIKGQYVPNALNNRWAAQEAIRCYDEDTKFCSRDQEPHGDSRCRNGRLDPEEDNPLIANPTGPQQVGGIGNESGFLEAGNVAALSSAQLVTNSAGRADFRITYGQQFGNWVKVRLQVRTAVAGTEFSKTTEFVLPVTTDDVELDIDPPGGIASTWGTSPSCQDTL